MLSPFLSIVDGSNGLLVDRYRKKLTNSCISNVSWEYPCQAVTLSNTYCGSDLKHRLPSLPYSPMSEKVRKPVANKLFEVVLEPYRPGQHYQITITRANERCLLVARSMF